MVKISLLCLAAHGRPTHQFDQNRLTWYTTVQDVIHGKCSAEFRDYKENHSPDKSAKLRITILINCILDNLSDFYKANMAASAIVLGSAPMILQSLGSTTAETALLGLRRPVLSFLLAGGSPAVTTLKASEFIQMLARFVRGGETRKMGLPGFRWSSIHARLRPIVSVAEYSLVGAATANVVMQAHRLGTHAVVFAPTTTWLPSLWTLIAVLIHAGGTIALHLRVRVYKPGPSSSGEVRSWVPDELIPLVFQKPSRMAWRREHIAYYALSWFLSICTVTHVVFGTLFSSLLFFSVRDATKVVARYAGSAIVCRAVVRFELAGLTEATTYGDGGAAATEAPGEEGSVSLDEAKDARGNAAARTTTGPG